MQRFFEPLKNAQPAAGTLQRPTPGVSRRLNCGGADRYHYERRRLRADGVVGWKGPAAPGAAKTMTAVQVPEYESLTDDEVARVGRLVREQVRRTAT